MSEPKLSAYSMTVDPAATNGYPFGCTAEHVAATLRRLADDLLQGRALVKSGTVVSKATIDNFAETVLILRLHERTTPTPSV